MGGFKWFRRKSKPKTIYKDGLRWNLLPKGVYGKEMYVPCNSLYPYWDLAIKGDDMTENKKYRVHELVQYNYSDIGEYIDEYHTDRPLRNDILVKILNNQDETICRLNKLIESYVPIWVVEKVVNRRIEATENCDVKKELEELLGELL